jgi:hypothetical protein
MRFKLPHILLLVIVVSLLLFKVLPMIETKKSTELQKPRPDPSVQGLPRALQKSPPNEFKNVMTAVISIPVLAVSLFIILSKRYSEADIKWAYGAAGTVLGYWLA